MLIVLFTIYLLQLDTHMYYIYVAFLVTCIFAVILVVTENTVLNFIISVIVMPQSKSDF